VAFGGLPLRNLEDFRSAARQFQFSTALTGAPILAHKTIREKLYDPITLPPVVARFMLFFGKGRQSFGKSRS
jgi:ABC-type molybdate transport system permease subunit